MSTEKEKEWKAEIERLESKITEQTANLKQKNQELEIEAATQRVRAHAMGMQKPDDIMYVLNVMREEIGKFELGNIATWIWTQDEEGLVTQWDISEVIHEGNLANFNFTFDLKKYPQVSRHTKHWDGKEAYYELLWNGKELQELIREVADIDKNNGTIFQEAVDSGQISNYWQMAALYSKGIVGLDFVTEPPGDASPILTKMANAFGMAYKRFEDLQKAEAQVREAKIEASLERIRGRAMALRNSDDLKEVVAIIFQELEKFELDIYDSNIIILNQEIKEYTMWGSGLGGIDLPPSFSIPHVDQSYFNQVFKDITQFDQLKEIEKFRSVHLSGKTLKNLHEFYITETEFKHAPVEYLEEMLSVDEITLSYAVMEYGILEVASDEPLPNETGKILKRFAKVVDLTYTRFIDLKQAEAQAREAKIETALERVRSRTMAMQKSDELNEVSMLLYDELKSLGINKSYINCGFMEVDEVNRIQNGWMTRPDGTEMEKFTLPMIGDPVLQKRYDAWKNQEPLFLQAVGGNELQKHIEFVNPQLGSKEVDEMVRNEFPETVIFYCGNFDQGYLSLISGEPLTKEEEAIFTRFTRVFQQTYTRFLDLQKAEQQAYESKVEASLERVRGMAAAMNHSDDLMQIAEEMFKELEILKINPLRYGVSMINGDKKEAELWASTVNDGHYLDMLGTLSLTWHPMLKQVLEAWEAQHEEVIYKLKGKELSDYYRRIGQINPGIPNLDILQDPETETVQYVSFFPFKSGALYAFTHGEPSDEGKSILKRFAIVFEQAHIRYNDLQIAENQAQLIREERDRLEIALKELEATKDQLVQQEKLASLGQLTAGIAHEIKNPLNFVNNFSEVSLEMIDEAREELSAGKKSNSNRSPFEGGGDSSTDESPRDLRQVDEALAILDEIEANLRKIHEHGSRADSIVKSMLQHSRGGDGKMESTSLNPLVKEYVTLAFHGMRAGKDPIDVDIDFQLDENVGNVPLIAEDFSRVIVNLCNNAFDACAERGRSVMRERLSAVSDQPSAYQPKLTVRALQKGKTVSIEIEDNGPGIPEEIKDKILQPFFTTKKGTAGTGLGLSITNDIVKAHGGNLDVYSQPGQTVFKIKLNS